MRTSRGYYVAYHIDTMPNERVMAEEDITERNRVMYDLGFV